MSPRLARVRSFFSVSALGLALPVLAIACTDVSENAAPIIDSVEAPRVVKEKDGTYEIPVTLLFHDNDGEAITHLRYRLPPNIDGMIDVPAPNPTRESAQITIVIQAADLDGEVPSTRSARTDGNDHDHDDDRDGKYAKEEDDAKHGRGKWRSRARALQLSVVDYRGAESLPASSTVTLD